MELYVLTAQRTIFKNRFALFLVSPIITLRSLVEKIKEMEGIKFNFLFSLVHSVSNLLVAQKDL